MLLRVIWLWVVWFNRLHADWLNWLLHARIVNRLVNDGVLLVWLNDTLGQAVNVVSLVDDCHLKREWII